jgi:hypothetical protein
VLVNDSIIVEMFLLSGNLGLSLNVVASGQHGAALVTEPLTRLRERVA